LKDAMETNNYIVLYSGVNGSTRAQAGVMTWIHKSITDTFVNYTYWSERIIKVKLNIGRGNYNFFDSTHQKKEKLRV